MNLVKTLDIEMRLQLTKDSPTKTVLRILNGPPLYHIHTNKNLLSNGTSRIYKIHPTNVQRYLNAEARGGKMVDVEPLPQEEIASIEWHEMSSTKLRRGGRKCNMKDVVKSKGFFSE